MIAIFFIGIKCISVMRFAFPFVISLCDSMDSEPYKCNYYIHSNTQTHTHIHIYIFIHIHILSIMMWIIYSNYSNGGFITCYSWSHYGCSNYMLRCIVPCSWRIFLISWYVFIFALQAFKGNQLLLLHQHGIFYM